MSVIGKWRNDYGSILDIRAHDPDGAFTGIYTSDTGASGTYLVNGWSPTRPSDRENQPFSLCVFWKPTDNSVEDPSWHWVSIMSGVLLLDAPGGVAKIQVLHGLVASTTIEAVQITRPGVYSETLTFDKLSPPSKKPHLSAAKNGVDAFQATGRLTLVNQNSSSQLMKITLGIEADGRAVAIIDLPDQQAIGRGFIDPAAPSNLRSLALTALAGADGKRALALGGFIDTDRKVAVLQLFAAQPVTYKNKYTAVIVDQETFSLSVGQ